MARQNKCIIIIIIRRDLLLPIKWIFDHGAGSSMVDTDIGEDKILEFESADDVALFAAMIAVMAISQSINRNEVQPLALGLIW